MANPRVHEIAAELGIPTKIALSKLQDMGEFVRSGSSSIKPPVARRLKAALSGPSEVTLTVTTAAGRAFDRLPAGLPMLVDELLGREPQQQQGTLSVLRAAVPGRFLLHVGAAAAADLAARSETTLGIDDLAEPRGVVAVRTGSEVLLLSWRLSGERVELSLLRVTRDRAVVVERGRADLVRGTFRAVERDDVARSLAVLARVPHLVPTRVNADAPDVEDASAAGLPVSPAQEADVRVVYLSRRVGEPTGLRQAVQRMSRWVVRGHWRNQWYPSTGSHRRIWISEHEAGNAEAPVRVRRIVYALR